MDFLKSIILTATFCIVASSAFSQTQVQLQDAFSKSYVLETEKKYVAAITTLEGLAATNSYEVSLRLGWLNYMNAQYDKSILAYNNSIVLMPVATEPLWGILNPYIAKKDWVNTEKTYTQILKLDPKNSIANYRLGLVFYYRKDYTTASKYFNIALNLSPFDYNIMLMSAWTHYFLGKTNDAKVLFNKVLLNQPNDVSALEGLGMIK